MAINLNDNGAHNRYLVHGVQGEGSNPNTSTYSEFGYIKIGDRFTSHPNGTGSGAGSSTAPQFVHDGDSIVYWYPHDTTLVAVGGIHPAYAMPGTVAYVSGKAVMSSPLDWANNNAYMGLIVWGPDTNGGPTHVISTKSGNLNASIPYFFDAQGSPLHLLEIITNIHYADGDGDKKLDQPNLCQDFGNISAALQSISAKELVSSEQQTYINTNARFMWGWAKGHDHLSTADDLDQENPEANFSQRFAALALKDLRFYIRAGRVDPVYGENNGPQIEGQPTYWNGSEFVPVGTAVERTKGAGCINSYRPQVTRGAYAYNISGRFTDQVFGNGIGASGLSDEHAAEFEGTTFDTAHREWFTRSQTSGSDETGFYLGGQGENDGSPGGDCWKIDKDMTSTLNQNKTYEIWLKPFSDGRQSLFYGAGTIQHVEIYAGTNTFRTEATTQNGYSFSGGTTAPWGTGPEFDGRDASNGFAINQWNCLTITFNTNHKTGDGTVNWYTNGILMKISNMWNGTGGNNEYFAFSHIGRATGSSAYLYAKSFHGAFDEFKIYDRVLTEHEIVNNVRSSRHFEPKQYSSGTLQNIVEIN
jgi:hypothetical protein